MSAGLLPTENCAPRGTSKLFKIWNDCSTVLYALSWGIEYVFKNAARTKRDGGVKSPGSP